MRSWWLEMLDELPLGPWTHLSESADRTDPAAWLEQLRWEWSLRSARSAEDLLRSPPHREERRLPDGTPIRFTYERCLGLSFLEQPMPRPQLEGWASEVCLFRGGPAGAWCLLHGLENLWLPSSQKPLRMTSWGLEGELQSLLQMRAHGSVSLRAVPSLTALCRALRAGRSEAIWGGFSAELPVSDLVDACRGRLRDNPIFLVLVTDADLSPLLTGIAESSPLLIFQVETDLMHLQGGLDLVSLGRIQVFGRGEASQYVESAARLLRKIRTVNGTTISFAEACQLQLPCFLDPGRWDPPGRVAVPERLYSATSYLSHSGWDPPEGELERLLALAEALPMPAEELADWRDNLEHRRPVNDLQGEHLLNELTLDLRARWLNYARQAPPVELEVLERRFTESRPPIPGWTSKHLLLNSGMAAVATLLQALENFVRPDHDRPLRSAMWGSYYETLYLMEVLRHEPFDWELCRGQDRLLELIGAGQVELVFVDPLAYDWDLDTLDLDAFLKAWYSRPEHGPHILVLDTTLSGNRFPLADFLERLGPSTHLVVHLTSVLKLDQEGLELANAGSLSFYTPVHRSEAVTPLFESLTQIRKLTRTGLGSVARRQLNVPFLFHQDYSNRVFAQNEFLATQVDVSRGGIFERIAHPALGPRKDLDWAVAPFVIFHLTEPTLLHQGMLLEILVDQAEKRGILFVIGASFGFRTHRFETIIPDVPHGLMGPLDARRDSPKSLFKIAMGAGRGPAARAIVELMQEIADQPDFETLDRTFKDRSKLSPATQMNVPFQVFSRSAEAMVALSDEELQALPEPNRRCFQELPDRLDPDRSYWGSFAGIQFLGHQTYFYRDLQFSVPDGVVVPRCSGALVFDQLWDSAELEDKVVYALGVGPGVEGVIAGLKGARVWLSDIHPPSVESARQNWIRHLGSEEGGTFIVSDILDAFPDQPAELITFNPPTVPLTLENEDMRRICALGTGLAYRFFDQVAHRNLLSEQGEVLMSLSNASDLESILSYAVRLGFLPTILDRVPWNTREGFELRDDEGQSMLFSFRLSDKR